MLLLNLIVCRPVIVLSPSPIPTVAADAAAAAALSSISSSSGRPPANRVTMCTSCAPKYAHVFPSVQNVHRTTKPINCHFCEQSNICYWVPAEHMTVLAGKIVCNSCNFIIHRVSDYTVTAQRRTQSTACFRYRSRTNDKPPPSCLLCQKPFKQNELSFTCTVADIAKLPMTVGPQLDKILLCYFHLAKDYGLSSDSPLLSKEMSLAICSICKLGNSCFSRQTILFLHRHLNFCVFLVS